MKKYARITPEGTRDLLFEECEVFRRCEKLLSGLFEQGGYREVQTPSLEFYDVFDMPDAEIAQERMYKLSDRKGRLMVLRPDCTLPIARLFSSSLSGAKPPVRLYYRQHVYRVNPVMTGKRDQFFQTGIELIGASDRRADLEVLVLAINALQLCDAPDFILELGHAGFFQILAAQLAVDEETKERIRGLIESKNYAALNDLLDRMEPSPAVTAIRALPRLFGGEEVFDEAAKVCGEAVREPLDCLRAIYSDLCQLGLGDRIRIDLGLVHQNTYYTGIIFRGYMRGYGDTVLSGGRYDRLLQEFDRPMAATGFGIHVDSLVQAMLERGEVAAERVPQVLVFGEDGAEIKALLHTKWLNSQGMLAETSVFSSLEESASYAAERGISRIDIVTDATVRSISVACAGKGEETV